MKEVEFDFFKLEYSDNDIEYIDLIICELKDKYQDIMNFFNLEKFDRKILIKLWNNIDRYRDFFNEKMKKYNKKVAEWETGRATNNSKECRIDLLCLSERRKSKGHQNDNINNLVKVVIHEFVHICFIEYNDRTYNTMTWFSEALATALADQYDRLDIDCTLEDIVKGKAHYINYYSMGKYLIDNCDKDYMLELIKNRELLEKSTEKIYNQTLEYISEFNKRFK